jgi:ABC-type glycerol-3-phosphate transport system permease component
VTARIGRLGLYVFLAGTALFFAIPLLVVISTSLKPLAEIREFSIFVPPASPGFGAWWKAWFAACTGLSCGGVHVGFWNSVRILIPSVTLSVLAGALNGYALSHWRVRGADLIMLAGLRGIDREIWRATRVEAIPPWRVYLSIVLPMLRPLLVTCVVLIAIAVVKSYDLVVAMTGGGPGYASDLPGKFVVDLEFERANIGQASAAAAVMLGSVLTVLAPYLYLELARRER